MGTKKCEQCKKTDAVICEGCCSKKSMVVLNHVLAYIATYFDRGSVTQLKLAVMGCFDEGDITKAKADLINSLQDTDIDL
jgi:4-hydroxy-3-methylbut-2-en-1-yl diphosphate synthase IspG/GcpE